MCNKIKQIYKGFPLVDLIPFFGGEGHPGATISHFSLRGEHFWLPAGFTSEQVRSVGAEGTRATLPQIIPLGGPQMGPKSTPFFM